MNIILFQKAGLWKQQVNKYIKGLLHLKNYNIQ